MDACKDLLQDNGGRFESRQSPCGKPIVRDSEGPRENVRNCIMTQAASDIQFSANFGHRNEEHCKKKRRVNGHCYL